MAATTNSNTKNLWISFLRRCITIILVFGLGADYKAWRPSIGKIYVQVSARRTQTHRSPPFKHVETREPTAYSLLVVYLLNWCCPLTANPDRTQPTSLSLHRAKKTKADCAAGCVLPCLFRR
jgi:hypothetical protein